MKLINVWMPEDNPVETAKGMRWQVRWKLDPATGAPLRDRVRTTFTRKGEAVAFMERVNAAAFDAEGWTLDHHGDPVKANLSGGTVVAAVTDYSSARWHVDWQDAQRAKVRPRLCELVARTLARPADRAALLAAYETQRADRGPRPEPTTTIGWAARWLRDHAFLPDHPLSDPRVQAGKEWIERESLAVRALDASMVATLRTAFVDGHARSTGRTYWQGIVVPFINWLTQTRRLAVNPLAGLPKLRRDVELERPDRREIPDLSQLHRFAEHFGRAHGVLWELWVLVCCLCAMRISESLAITGTSFHRQADGRWLLEVNDQERHSTAWASDDGLTTRKRKRTKSTRDRTPPKRPVPIPAPLAVRLEAHFGDRLGTDPRRLFVGPRGAIAPVDTVRTWFSAAVLDLFGDDPYLATMTPHTLRHAGMTYWFAAGADEARIQRWGGWQSLKEMQDTYRGIIRSLDAEQFDGIDQFHQAPVANELSPSPTASHGDLAESMASASAPSAKIIVLDQFRQRRQRAVAEGG